MSFSEWLETSKGFTHKSAHDANSRLKRIFDLTGKENVSADTLSELAANENFLSLSVCVKSQLRRTTRLYLEYQESTVK